ncbi:putative inactive tRNA-specific adenosine deaminase-like protein 3 [Dorcoceras hygrometricum]|uniref:Putative inactive tRNA-specific adenosine deaminase-like protein 3 n=1 Tax=Dorcoceras hygrometricum TaxID=472368 RepID=A0A2Z7C8L8_9LAMI|nr:putative inactive tRNA-specific adenosine deaminase-like protein 3 [Dorcoceras hygrometricum]
MLAFSSGDVSTSCKKREMKIEFRLLIDILAKSIFVKAGSFDAVTHKRFLMMAAINGGVKINWGRLLFNIFKDMVTAESRQARGYAVQIYVLLKNIPNLELVDSEEFPPLKILTVRTVGRYIAINDKITVEDVEGVVGKSRVKKTPTKKAVSKKRPAAVSEAPVAKKKRTYSGRAVSKEKYLAIVSVALDAKPIQTVDPTSAMPAAHPPAPKRRAPKRKVRMTAGSDDEFVEKESAMETAVVVQKASTSADDVDTIIEQVVAETAQMDTDAEGTNVSEPDVGVQAGQINDATEEHWFNASYEEFVAREASRMIESGSDTDEEIVAHKYSGTDVGIQMETGPDAYFVEEPSEETDLIQGTETADVVPTTTRRKLMMNIFP